MQKANKLLLTLIGVLAITASSGQSNSELMSKAREYAFNGKRDSARIICDRILASEPDYYQALVLKGRTFAWDKQYDEARSSLQQAIVARPSSTDAYSALFDTEYWSDNYKQAREVANSAIEIHPNEAQFYVDKAKVELKLEDRKAAADALDRALQINPADEEAIELRKDLRKNLRNNRIKLNYAIDMFRESNPWHEYSIEYSHRFDNVSAIVRVAEARRFDKADQLLELDLYPKIRSGTYAFLSGGVGEDQWLNEGRYSLYPVFRGAAELFQRLPSSFEASAGFRYLRFGNDTWIGTFSLGKYYKSYWFNIRTYLSKKEVGYSNSWYLFAREYFSGANDYVGIILGTGISPDLANLNQDALIDPESLRAYSIRLERKWTFLNYWIGSVSVGYQAEELRVNDFRSRYSLRCSVAYNF